MDHHLHTSTISSCTITSDPIQSLGPSMFFPWFHHPKQQEEQQHYHQQQQEEQQFANQYTHPQTTYTTSSSSNGCGCFNDSNQPGLSSLAASEPNFIQVESRNPQQPVLLPIPTIIPPPPFLAYHTNNDSNSNHHDGMSWSSLSSSLPVLVYCYGSTQVDTMVPSRHCMERTRYSWDQLADYIIMYCWNLPEHINELSSTSPLHTTYRGQKLSDTNESERPCPEEQIQACPGHPWVKYNYQVTVQQWQEQIESENNNNNTANNNSNNNQNELQQHDYQWNIIESSTSIDDVTDSMNEKRRRLSTNSNNGIVATDTNNNHDHTSEHYGYKLPEVNVVDPDRELPSSYPYPWMRSPSFGRPSRFSFIDDYCRNYPMDMIDGDDVINDDKLLNDSENDSGGYGDISDSSIESTGTD